MSFRLGLLGLLALVVTSLSACIVVPVPAHRAYYEAPPAVIVAPYPHYGYYRRW